MIEFFGLFILLAGFIIGLGAVTVIDLHGFLGRRSPYWTETTIRAHKVTKPLIWLGMTLALIGGVIFYSHYEFNVFHLTHLILVPVMVLNGLFLSFYVSPYLLKMEKEGRQKELLPNRLQFLIVISFLISFFSWWGSLGVLVWFLLI